MTLTVFVCMYLWSSVLGLIANPLDQFCSDDSADEEQHEWQDVPLDEWYWGTDYNVKVAAGEEDIYPAGFKPFTLVEFNQPPVCVTVPGSGDKKVEILIETTVEDAHICIHDASDIGFANNDVGNVDTCGMGLLYACFTAAEAEDITNGNVADFSFYVYCKESCEASDVGLWMRVRTSDQTWEAGKTGVDDDLEMWCEMEKGTVLNDTDGTEHNYFTYPEDLVADEPVVFPFRIVQVDGTTVIRSDGKSNALAIALVSVFIILFFIIGGCCVVKNHEQLPDGCVKFIPCVDTNVDDYE